MVECSTESIAVAKIISFHKKPLVTSVYYGFQFCVFAAEWNQYFQHETILNRRSTQKVQTSLAEADHHPHLCLDQPRL